MTVYHLWRHGTQTPLSNFELDCAMVRCSLRVVVVLKNGNLVSFLFGRRPCFPIETAVAFFATTRSAWWQSVSSFNSFIGPLSQEPVGDMKASGGA